MPGTDEFGGEYQAALNGKIEPRETEQPQGTRAKNGSQRWLIEQYYASAEFTRLDTSTKSARHGILDNLCSEPVSDEISNLIGSLPYASMPTSKVRALRDRKAEFPEAANGHIKALRQVVKYAIAAEHPGAERNPARDVPYMKTGSQGFHTWTIAEVLQYAKKHPIGTKAHLALALLLFTGQRRSDVVKFGRQHIKNGWLTFTGACIAAENGAAEKQLMAIFGWQAMKEAAHYTKRANQQRLAASAIPLLSLDQTANNSLPLLGPVEESGSKRGKKPRKIKA
ncbi:hypothetical protein [Bradyrhizobium sp. SZCCHNR2028]|uniref:hypothetical protein n=1 Tax=Bradyrhizobium sp. SZCCHNR2028 TaxID=3057382 RepID=UPI0028E4A9AC|nr:hypothetical protein [Bradyrhizobium sp. SZCCHNR2028]